jgi:hypothetical protein
MRSSASLAVMVAITLCSQAVQAGATVKPGDLITAGNAASVQDLVSPGNFILVKQGMQMKVVPTGRLEWPPPYKAATEKYASQVSLNSEGALQNYVAGGLTPSRYPASRLVSAEVDPPRGSMPTGSRGFGVVWSVGAGISGVYCTLQTRLTTSNNWLLGATVSALSLTSFSPPPFTLDRGGAKSFQVLDPRQRCSARRRTAIGLPAKPCAAMARSIVATRA